MQTQECTSVQLTNCSINGIRINDKVTWTDFGTGKGHQGILIAFSCTGTVWVQEIVYKKRLKQQIAVAEIRQLRISEIRKLDEETSGS